MCYTTRVAGLDDVAFSTPALRPDRCVVDIGITCVGWVVVLVLALPLLDSGAGSASWAFRGRNLPRRCIIRCRAWVPYILIWRAWPGWRIPGRVVVTLVLGMEEVRGGREGGRDVLLRRSTSWAPGVFHSPIPSSSTNEVAHIPQKRGGAPGRVIVEFGCIGFKLRFYSNTFRAK